MTFADAVRDMMTAAKGNEPDENALSLLGGWERLAAEGSGMADDRWLVVLVRLAVRDAAAQNKRSGAFVEGIKAVAVAATESEIPTIFADSVDVLIASSEALEVVGEELVKRLSLIVDASFAAATEAAPAKLLRSADALERLTRLNAAGVGQSFGLLALLSRFDAPIPKPLAAAVVRAVGTAIDCWPHADSLASVVRRVAGLDALGGQPWAGADPEDVASDATWVLAGIELVRALRSMSAQAMAECLERSASYLRVASESYERDDAELLLSVVEILRGLLRDSGFAPTVRDLGIPGLDSQALDELATRITQFNLASMGLNHWYGDSKRSALTAWMRLAEDLGRLRNEFGRSSFYKAEVVVDDLLQIYVGSRSIGVTRRSQDCTGVLELVQPIIETGFARAAGLMCNLEDHAQALKARLDSESSDGKGRIAEQLAVADKVLVAARLQVIGDGGGQEKAGGGAALVPLPPPLSLLVPAGSAAANEIGAMAPAAIVQLARAIDDLTIGKHSLNLIESEIYSSLRTALATSQDYRDEPAKAVDVLLRLIIRFVASRTNAQSDLYPYLFDKEAKEAAIHRDLHDYLISSELGSITEFEVQHVGGGRIDLRVRFDKFAINIEMKVDSTRVPIQDKAAYLKQAASYQASDIRVGFLVALRHKAFDPSGPPPHLSALIGHTEFSIEGDPVGRHIITVQVPGSRTSPSRMK